MTTKVSATSNRFSSLLLFATVALAPLPFGSVDPMVTAAWSGLLGVTLILTRPRDLKTGQAVLLCVWALVVAAYAVVLHEQISDQPWFAIAAPHPLWSITSQLLQTPIPASVAIARDQALWSLGAPMAAALALTAGFLIGLEATRARQLLRVVAVAGAVYALFAMISFVIDPSKVLWRDKQAYLTSLTAPFMNRNTAAVYFGSCALIWELALCERIGRLLPNAPHGWRNIVHAVQASMGRKTIAITSGFFVCLAAMFLTGSRAGVVGSLAMQALAPALFFWRKAPGRSGVAVTLAVSVLLALMFLETLGVGVNARFDVDRLTGGGRLETYRSTLRMIADHPWLGTGLGTFAWAFPAYRSGDISVWGIWDKAHDTPLEFAAEMGVPLTLIVGVAWLVALAVLLNGVRARRRDVILPITGLLTAALALLHSLIDFSLQIPGFSITVFAVMGAGLAQSFRTRQGPAPRAAKLPALSRPTVSQAE